MPRRMTFYDIVNPQALGTPKGWNNGMLAPAGGRLLFVAGQTGRGEDGTIVEGGFVAQFERALTNALEVVRQAGGGPDHVGRMTVYVTSRAEYLESLGELGVAWRRVMGRHYPAMALVEVCGLVDRGAVVEIETTAVVPGGA